MKYLACLFCCALVACSSSTEPAIDTFSPVVIIDVQPDAGTEYSDRYIHWAFVADPAFSSDISVFTKRQSEDCYTPDTIQMPPLEIEQTVQLLYGIGDSVTCGLGTDNEFEENQLSFRLEKRDTIRIQRHDLTFIRR